MGTDDALQLMMCAHQLVIDERDETKSTSVVNRTPNPKPRGVSLFDSIPQNQNGIVLAHAIESRNARHRFNQKARANSRITLRGVYS